MFLSHQVWLGFGLKIHTQALFPLSYYLITIPLPNDNI